MCKCCQECMESCYWHLIEKRFCFDESIALYEEPVKDEKNNNMFDNIAFYDSVSVIAGRAIVTIDPLPPTKPIVQQPLPTNQIKWEDKILEEKKLDTIPTSPTILSLNDDLAKLEKRKPDIFIKKTLSTSNIPDDVLDGLNNITPNTISKSTGVLLEPDPTVRKKSLRERRMSKSLYLKLDLPREIPIIRQHSMPKFYLDTPEINQTEATLLKNQSSALTSPVTNSVGFRFDLYSVVQMEKAKKSQNVPPAPIHREPSRLALIKEKIKLRKTKIVEEKEISW